MHLHLCRPSAFRCSLALRWVSQTATSSAAAAARPPPPPPPLLPSCGRPLSAAPLSPLAPLLLLLLLLLCVCPLLFGFQAPTAGPVLVHRQVVAVGAGRLTAVGAWVLPGPLMRCWCPVWVPLAHVTRWQINIRARPRAPLMSAAPIKDARVGRTILSTPPTLRPKQRLTVILPRPPPS
jgi:hypothetical protein